MRAELRDLLRDAGASDDDIDRAEAEGWLALLALDRVLMPGVSEYDLPSFSRVSGLDEKLLRRLWRALGFPDVLENALVFTQRDVEAAIRLFGRADSDDLDRERLIQLVQVVSGSMARIASVEAGTIADVVQELQQSGMSQDDVAWIVAKSDRWDDLALLIDYEHRVQLRAALWRRLVLDAVPDAVVGVAFVDLSGYTRTTAHLSTEEITALVARWEQVAYDTASVQGARIVKTIGDEVMLVGLAPNLARATLTLRDAAATDPELLPVRAGLAAGPVVARNGDYYGPVVNLASRLTEVAAPNMVLVPETLREQVPEQDFTWEPQGVRELRGIGPVGTFALEWPG